MQDRRQPLACACRALLFALFPLTAAAQEDGAAAVGDLVPDCELAPLTNHDGRTRLSELFGQPVLFSGWRRNMSEGLHSAWIANQMLSEHGDDGLVVVLQDRERWNGDPSWVVDVDF